MYCSGGLAACISGKNLDSISSYFATTTFPTDAINNYSLSPVTEVCGVGIVVNIYFNY